MGLPLVFSRHRLPQVVLLALGAVFPNVVGAAMTVTNSGNYQNTSGAAGYLCDNGLNSSSWGRQNARTDASSFSVTITNDTGAAMNVGLRVTKVANSGTGYHINSADRDSDPTYWNTSLAAGQSRVVPLSVTVMPMIWDSGNLYVVGWGASPGTNIVGSTQFLVEMVQGDGGAVLESDTLTVGFDLQASLGSIGNANSWASTGAISLTASGGAPQTTPYRFRATFAKLITEAVSGTLYAFNGVDHRELGSVSIPEGSMGEGVEGKLFHYDFEFDLASDERVVVVGDGTAQFIEQIDDMASDGEFTWEQDGYVDPPAVNPLFFQIAETGTPQESLILQKGTDIDPNTGEESESLVGTYTDSTGTEVSVDLSEVLEPIDESTFSAANETTKTTDYGRSGEFVAGTVANLADVTGGVSFENAEDSSGVADLESSLTSAATKGEAYVDGLELDGPPSNVFDVGTWAGTYDIQWPDLMGFTPPPIQIPLDDPWVGMLRALLLFLLQVSFFLYILNTAIKYS